MPVSGNVDLQFVRLGFRSGFQSLYEKMTVLLL